MPGQLAALIRRKYPSVYDDLDDAALEAGILSKYPEYSDLTEMPPPGARQGRDAGEPPPGFARAVGRRLLDIEPYAAGLSIAGHTAGLAFPPLHGVGAIGDVGLAGAGAVRVVRGIRDRSPMDVGIGVLEAAPFASRLLRAGRVVKELPAVLSERTGRLIKTPQPIRPLEDTLARELSRMVRSERRGVPSPSVSLPNEQLPSSYIGHAIDPLRARPVSPPKPTPQMGGRLVPASERLDDVLRGTITRTEGPTRMSLPNEQLPLGQPIGIQDFLQKVRVRPARTRPTAPLPPAAPAPLPVSPALKTGAVPQTVGGIREAAPISETAMGVGLDDMTPGMFAKLPNKDASQVLRDMRQQFGAEETARRTGAQVDVIRMPGPSREPLKATEGRAAYEYLRRTLDPKGQVHPQLLARIALGGASAAAASTQGDTSEERAANALIFGAAGALVPSILRSGTPVSSVVKAARAGTPTHDLGLLERWRYFSMLARPGSLIRATAGSFTGAAVSAMVEAGKGNVKGAAKIIGSLIQDSPKIYLKGLADPSHLDPLLIAQGRVPTNMGGILSLPSRFFAAADAAGVHAMRQGGISTEEALRYTLSGPPTSKFGKAFHAAMSNHFLGRLASPFSRVAVQGVERGLEFSPAGPFMRSAIRPGAELSKREAVVRGIVGTGAAATYGVASGAVASGIREKRGAGSFRRTAAAFAGPMSLPTLIASAWAEAAARDPRMPETIPPAVLQAILWELPLVDQGDIRRIPQSFIPGGALDVISSPRGAR